MNSIEEIRMKVEGSYHQEKTGSMLVSLLSRKALGKKAWEKYESLVFVFVSSNEPSESYKKILKMLSFSS